MYHLFLILLLIELLEKGKYDIDTCSKTCIRSGLCKTLRLAALLVKGYIAVAEYEVLAV